MEGEKGIHIGVVQDFPEEIPGHEEGENIGVNELDFESDSESQGDSFTDFNLNLSLDILDTKTDEVDTEFLEALNEIEGKKSFPCPNCTKVCKSKGGLTRHTNSKHREATADLLEDYEKSRLRFESLAGIVEAIKTDNLYGTELIAAVKIASCSKALFDAVLPLNEKFCRKRNQDRLLEEFYGLILDASTYLNCSDSHAANVIMIETPDRLVVFFKLCQNHDEARTTTACDLKLDRWNVALFPTSQGTSYLNFTKSLEKARISATRN